MITFDTLVEKNRGKKFLDNIKDKKIVGIDPGATTGVTVFNGITQEVSLQISTGKGEDTTTQAKKLKEFEDILFKDTDFIVIEDYRVYGTHSDTHIGIRLYTPELIGMLKLKAFEYNIPVFIQSASQAKGFFSNNKLEAWGYNKSKGGHAKNHWRDATRHVLYLILFNKEFISGKKGG